MVGHLVKYTKFYSEPIPENPIELLFDIPKEELIVTNVIKRKHKDTGLRVYCCNPLD